MGTVGLSFGSPTSGTGFDVSSTVASIVSNLQNVETPWKNQLKGLESEDTAISSLGSLFSTLSNDVSQLTDFQGAMAVKSGSSSDTNVLELTSASTSAMAGTHTVVVNSLAQTSSGYLAEITNAADKLSGSVTLQVGSATAQTITLNSSDNTLSGLASAINSSGVGITASVLTDATGSRLSLVSGTSGAKGNIAISSNSLTAAVSNTLSYTGTAGTQTENSTGTLSPVSSTTASLSGKLLVTVGGGTQQTIDMSDVSTAEGGATLGNLAKYIGDNSATLGFSATVVANSDGTSSLSLTSGTPESTGTLTVNSSLVDSATALGYANTVTGANASLTVDGINLTSASNTVTNLIPGLTFQLLSTSPEQSDNSLEPVQVVIANDNSGVESAVNQMVSDYNSLIGAINAQEGNTSSGTAEPLFGSPTLSLLQEQLLSGLNIQNPNGSLDAVTNVTNPVLSGSITIQVGNGTAQTITLNSSQTSLSDLAQAINSGPDRRNRGSGHRERPIDVDAGLANRGLKRRADCYLQHREHQRYAVDGYDHRRQQQPELEHLVQFHSRCERRSLRVAHHSSGKRHSHHRQCSGFGQHARRTQRRHQQHSRRRRNRVDHPQQRRLANALAALEHLRQCRQPDRDLESDGHDQ